MTLQPLPLAGGDQRPAARDRGIGVLVSICFVGLGVVSIVAAGCLLVAWGPDVAATGGWAGPHALALVHVVALGFVTSVALGVLYHLAPLAFGHRLPVPIGGLGICAVYAVGAGLFVDALAAQRPTQVAIGGAVMGGAVLAAGLHLGAVVAGRRRHYPPTLFQIVAVASLCCVAALGVTLAVMLDAGAPSSFLRILGAKIILAVGGWLAVLVVGVSYQLVPMFTPTPARARFLPAALALLVVGTVLAAVAALAGAPLPVRVAGAVPFAAGIGLHAVDVVRMVAARRHRELNPVTTGQVAGLVLLLVGSAEGVVAMSGEQPWPQLAVTTALLGWTSVLIGANAQRIVPFIVWQGLPAGRRPRTFGSVPAQLGWLALAAALATWITMSLAVAQGWAPLGRCAGVALLAFAGCIAAIAATGLRGTRASATR